MFLIPRARALWLTGPCNGQRRVRQLTPAQFLYAAAHGIRVRGAREAQAAQAVASMSIQYSADVVEARLGARQQGRPHLTRSEGSRRSLVDPKEMWEDMNWEADRTLRHVQDYASRHRRAGRGANAGGGSGRASAALGGSAGPSVAGAAG